MEVFFFFRRPQARQQGGPGGPGGQGNAGPGGQRGGKKEAPQPANIPVAKSKCCISLISAINRFSF